jgi:hypothetical protein
MRLPATLTAVTLMLVALSVTACSSKSTTSIASSTASTPLAAGGAGTGTATSAASGGASSSVNVCSLLTAAQASSIVGVTYTAAKLSQNFAGSMCAYTGTTVPVPMNVFLTVNAGSTAAWNEELSELDPSPVTINGLGDRAVTTTDQLAAQSGNWIVQVDGGDPVTVGGAFTKSIAVAKAILAASR